MSNKIATYAEIKEWIKNKYPNTVVVQTCWIAEVKVICGIPIKPAPNRINEERVKPCPDDMIDIIKDAFCNLNIIERETKVI